jgi:hypothetical protein
MLIHALNVFLVVFADGVFGVLLDLAIVYLNRIGIGIGMVLEMVVVMELKK